jgi:4'-phosphopantetheinyl transferase superfamily protein
LDAEQLRDPADECLFTVIAAFAPTEQDWVRALPARCRDEAILRLWALKEAYAKAKGLGLHLPFDSFAFELNGHRGVRQFLWPEQESRGEEWRFFEGRLSAFRLALAYRPPSIYSAPRELTIGTAIPGRPDVSRSLVFPERRSQIVPPKATDQILSISSERAKLV